MGVRSDFGVGVTQVLGTTGWAFIRQAWSALAKIDFDRTSLGGRLAYASDRQNPWWSPRSATRGTPFNTQLRAPREGEGGRGTRWDNDFNRALWAWLFLQWDEYNLAHGLPSAYDQFFAWFPATSPQRDGWVSLLNMIENCEVTQSISRAALGVAATLVADSLGLISSTTTQNVWLDPQTVLLRYGVDPFAPLPEFQPINRWFATWRIDQAPSSNVPPYGAPVTLLTAEPVLSLPGATGTGTTGTGTSTVGPSPVPPAAGGGGPPVEVGSPSLTAAQELGLVAGYTVGGMVLVGGLWTIYQSMKEER